jgi:hypothetical protein
MAEKKQDAPAKKASPKKTYRKKSGNVEWTRGGVKKLGRLLPKEAKAAFKKFGFSQTRIISQWKNVVGVDMAAASQPMKMRFPRGQRDGGTLDIMVDAGWALELQHLEPLMIERINGFFGYAAVAKITITQGPTGLAKPKEKLPEPELTPEQKHELDALVANTKDDELRETLTRLGAGILSHAPKSPKS